MSNPGRNFQNVRLVATTLLLIGWVGVGCGYHSVLPDAPRRSEKADDSDRSGGSGKITRLAVNTIRNDSPEPWLDRVVSDALRRELGMRAAFDLVVDPADAELLLRGRIRPLRTKGNSFSSFVAALEYSVTLQVDLEVVRDSGDIVRLDARTLSESELYLASPDIETTRTNRLEALRHLSDVLASRVADSIELMAKPIASDSPDSAEQEG